MCFYFLNIAVVTSLVPRFEAAYDNHIAWSDGVQHRYLLLVGKLGNQKLFWKSCVKRDGTILPYLISLVRSI
jgi:hypothetical protein